MTKKQDEQRRSHNATIAHFTIDGKPYTTSHTVYTAALEKGWAGSESVMQGRIARGKRTWDELLKPVDQVQSTSQKKLQQRKRDEMADIIAQLDARKNNG